MSTTASLPITRREARAQGLKTYNMGLSCRRHAGAPRLTSTGKCTACIDHEKAALCALKARIKASLVKTAKAQALREIARDSKERAKAERQQEPATASPLDAKAATAERKKEALAVQIQAREESARRFHAARAIDSQHQTSAPASLVDDDSPPWD